MRAGDTFLNQHAFFSGGECPYLKANYTAGVAVEIGQRGSPRVGGPPEAIWVPALGIVPDAELSRGIVALTAPGSRLPTRQMRGFKRTASTEADWTTACYLTRGAASDEWHVWNTSERVLNLRAGDEVRARVVDRAFGADASLLVGALSELTVRGSSSRACVLGRDVRFRRDRTPCSVALDSAVSQADLLRVCASKGVQCSRFLEHCVGSSSEDEELQLGSALRSLFVASVKEMLSRKYDIAHHYALFDRALGLYYSSEARSAPPGEKEVTDPGGWLDRSAEEHAALHGTPLVGSDHASFSKWNYPGVEMPPEPPSGDDEPTGGSSSSDGNGRGDEQAGPSEKGRGGARRWEIAESPQR
ncbi:hypothetical protein Q5P01_000803 [Channa striata]|uniref:Uncharacterized protein n=1 Tax=Channa striata TaxID=64152 RepID=A0AA88LMX7_CHASR|nr:hypothetical protein Q5P01_000803 [Channa striata]